MVVTADIVAMSMVTLVSAVRSSLGFSECRYSEYTGSRGNSDNGIKVGCRVHGSSDSTGCNGNGQTKVGLYQRRIQCVLL